MPASGKEGWEYLNELFQKEDQRRAEMLAKAKAEAAARGKEPFDLEKLEQLCDTSSEGRVDPVETRRKDFEFMYYVHNPDIQTIKEFAAFIERTNKW